EIVFLQNWIDERMVLRALDADRRLATLSSSPRPLEANGRYWVENVREGLSEPGTWFFDARAGRVYYRSRSGDDPVDAEVVVPRVQTLVHFEGDEKAPVSNVTLRGLTFQHTAWVLPADGYVDPQAANTKPAAVMARGAVRCQVAECRFERLGGYAVEFGAACHANRITRCEVSDAGGGGVKIGVCKHGCDIADPAVSSGNVVEDCHIHGIGRVYPAAVGVLIGHSRGNRVAHNHIHDTYYTGVSLGWTWGYGRSYARDNVVEFNHIHHIGQGMLSDMGGIYTLGTQPGTVLRNNLIHDVSRQPKGYGGWGIYTDEGSAGILIENNVVYRCESGGFHQHYGRENLLRNNIFAWAQEGQMVRTREEAHVSFTLERNLILCDGESPLAGAWSNGRFVSDYNLFFLKDQNAFHAATINVGIKPFPHGFLQASRADDAVTIEIGESREKPDVGGLRLPRLPGGTIEPAEALWADATRLPPMAAFSGAVVPMTETDIRLLRNEQTLFVRAECLHSRVEDRDTQLRATRRETIEVLLRPDRTKTAVIQFIVFSDGERRTHYYACGPQTGLAWMGSASRTTTGWTARLSLPIQDIISVCGGSTSAWSIFVGRCAMPPAVSFADWQALGHDTHSVLTDPMFADADAEDWRLRDDSPALAIGFRPIDLDDVGPRQKST
ncbi:MAG: right-handed parallel beta-helix repeat-containing protein, partial [Kiritimatiellae bacterium]|nr:right-handed parallel beta-helix repeat-containing protein [Kiritimatiellia bacterium]